MSSCVRVKMTVCDKITKVCVSLRDDGDLDVKVRSNCDHVRQYANGLEVISIQDVTELGVSRLYEPERRAKASATCLVPSAIINAAWMELGMLSRSRAIECGNISIEFLDE